MYKSKLFNKVVASFLAISLLFPSVGNIGQAFADNQTSVDISVSATDVNITVPLNFACAINPNLEKSEGGFSYAENLVVSNESKAPILLSVNAFVDNAQTFTNDVLPDGLPEELEWNKLNVKQTKEYFALGLKATDSTEWFEQFATEYSYAKAINEEAVALGVIGPGRSTNFDLDAYYGRAVKEGFTFSYNITWFAELYDGEAVPSTYTVDREATSSLEYELNNTQTASIGDFLDELLGVETVHAAELSKGEIDESRVVGTAYVSGVKDSAETDIYVADYYETTNGDLYKIIGIKEGTPSDYTVSGDSVKYIELAPTVSEIGDYGIGDCENLTDVVVKSEELTVGTNNFEQCEKVENVLTVSPVVKETLVTKVDVITEEKTTVFETIKELETKVDEIKNEVSALAPGLYDENNNLLASWEELVNTYGLDISRTPTEEEWEEGDPLYMLYTILMNNEDLMSATKLVIDDSITEIGASACSSELLYVEVPDTVTTIGEWAFDGVLNVNYKGTAVDENENNWGAYYLNAYIEEDFLYEEETKTTLLAYFGSSNSVEIPSTVTSIGAYAFEGCTNLTTVSFAEGSQLTSIGAYAFTSTAIESIKIPATVTNIGESAFASCKSLETVEFAEGSQLETIGAYAFSDCTGLTIVSLSSGITTIPSHAFNNCTSLTSVVIPSSVTSIENDAFSNCKNLSNIVIPEGVTSIGDYAFKGCTGLISIEIPSSVETIGQSAFSGCSGLESIEIPEGVTTIPSSSFQNCANLESIIIPSTVTTIDYAFADCTALKTVNYRGTEDQWKEISINLTSLSKLNSCTINYNYTE